MHLEIGGGDRNLGGDWINVDLFDGADVVHDLNVVPWPFEDESVDALYSSHCIEHVKDPTSFLVEVARICKRGSKAEIRCPSPFSEMAFVAGHVSVVSPQLIRNMEIHFPEMYWPGPRRLKLVQHRYQPSEALSDAKRDLPFLRGLNDQVIMRWIPGTAHECVFIFEVH